MALKRINQSPTIADTIVFDIPTPDSQGCFDSEEYQLQGGPYKVDKVTIYHIDIDYNSQNYEQYDKNIYDTNDWNAYELAKKNACNAPTDDNILVLTQAQQKLILNAKEQVIYYNSADAVAIIGNDLNPAWLSSDTDNAFITRIDEDSDGNPQYGHFELHWEPKGMREGDYFICWTWTPNPAGDSLTAHMHFTLYGNTQLTTSIPSHYTPKDKYETLLERYLPEMYKISISDADIAPQVFQELNMAIAKGFTFLEDMGNQIIDLQDANAINESLLPYLSNLFNLRLKSNDPTLWRAQIKRAVPLFKKKGTLSALQEAFHLAGMTLNKFTRMWQVISLYTWQELFNITDEEELTFSLEKNAILPVDTNNFEVYYRAAESEVWTQLTTDYVYFTSIDGNTTVTWVGHELSFNPIVLEEGDSFRVIYLYNLVPDISSQLIENYIRTLPLADSRDERDQDCPLKNWNARLIEEDDSMFDVVIQTRHPYHDPLIYGWVRTEFPYSENIYNMDEYNGSTRESKNPCDIDCQFLDPCLYCQSSKFTIDVEIEKLSNDRILETQEIIQEFVPFHAVMHAVNFSGGINEYLANPEETIEMLVHTNVDEFTVAGGGQMIFMRTMDLSKEIDRDDLAIKTIVATDLNGTVYNDNVVLFSPDEKLSGIGLNHQSVDIDAGVRRNNLLEVLAPSSNAGEYTVSSPSNNHAVVGGTIGENPLNTKEFTFRLSNEIYYFTPTSTSVELSFQDDNVNFVLLNAKSKWDVNENPHHIDTGDAWYITIPSYSENPYVIKEILYDGSLLLEDTIPSTLPVIEDDNISYTLYNGSGIVQATSITGSWVKTGRGILNLINDGTMNDVRNVFKIGDYIKILTSQYQVSGYVYNKTHLLYLDNYNATAMSGISVIGYRRLITGARGYFQYIGMNLQTTINYEQTLSINNGANPPAEMLENNSFKENYLILIGSDYYAVSEWDETTITLNGPYRSWKTLSAGGTPSTAFSILQYEKQSVNIDERPYMPSKPPGHYFGKIEATEENWESDKLDRGDNEVIEIAIQNAPSTSFLALTLNQKKKGDELQELQGMEESISYKIEFAKPGEI